MKINQIGRSILTNSFFSRMVQMRRCFLTTCTKPLHEEKNIKQMCYYGKEKGRSMVEMLGVLAIIGVLSVGAIAGYQKAMMKYKLNKHAESFNLLLNTLLQYSDQLQSDVYSPDGKIEYYAETLKRLNAIPDGIKYSARTTLKDIFGTIIVPLRYNSFAIAIRFNDIKEKEQICANYVQAAKENCSELHQIYMQQSSNSIVTSYIGILYGDKYCDKNKTCIRNMTIDNIDTLCNNCVDDCTLYFTW